MTAHRQAKVDGVAVPDVVVDHDEGAELLVIGWGSSSGVIGAAARRVREGGRPVAIAHLRHLQPLPANLGEVLRSYERVLVLRDERRRARADAARALPRRRGVLREG